MRLKNFTLVFLMGLFGLFTTNLFAQEDATIAPDDILYWIGDGENQVIFIGNWNDPDTAMAWGYRFSEETLMVKDVLDGITAVDSRLSYTASGSWFTDLMYYDGVLDLRLAGSWWMFNVNGQTAGNYFDAQPVVNGDVIKFGDESCGIITDPELWTYVWTTPVAPVAPIYVDATIDPSEILYWIGEGENEVIFVGNWADPETALAWGYRFSEETVTVKDVLDGITAVDPRLSYTASGSWFTDLMYNDGILNLRLAGGWWMFNVNGQTAGNYFDAQPVVNGDVIKFGDESCGIITDPELWTYIWLTHIEPVQVYDAVSETNTGIALYPNPATTYTMLEVSGMNGAMVTVSDLQGRVIRSFVVSQTSDPIRVETDGVKAGLYFVTVSDGTNRKTVKLTVK